MLTGSLANRDMSITTFVIAATSRLVSPFGRI